MYMKNSYYLPQTKDLDRPRSLVTVLTPDLQPSLTNYTLVHVHSLLIAFIRHIILLLFRVLSA
jgi:hypothetical protein